MPKFINTELKSDSESDSDLHLEKIEAKVDDELEESGSDRQKNLRVVRLKLFKPLILKHIKNIFRTSIN